MTEKTEYDLEAKALAALVQDDGPLAFSDLRDAGLDESMFQGQSLRRVFGIAEQLEKEHPGNWTATDLEIRVFDTFPELVEDFKSGREAERVIDTPPIARGLYEAHRRREVARLQATISTMSNAGMDCTAAIERLRRLTSKGKRPKVHLRGAGEIMGKGKKREWFMHPLLAKGKPAAVIGAGGAGKSGAAVHVICAAIAGKAFGELQPGDTGNGKIVILGKAENDALRYERELQQCFAKYPEAKDEILRRLLIWTDMDAEDDEDADMDFDALPEVEEALREVADGPDGLDGVVFDSIAYFFPPGADPNDDRAMKETTIRLHRMVHRIAPGAWTWMVHHARGGRENSLAGLDPFEATEFGRNSKMLAYTCRSVLNLTPYVRDGKRVGFVAMISKNNLAFADEIPPAFAMVYDRELGPVHDVAFDPDAYRAELAKKNGNTGTQSHPRNTGKGRTESRSATVPPPVPSRPAERKQEAVETVAGNAEDGGDTAGEISIADCIDGDEAVPAEELASRFAEKAQKSRRTAYRRINEAKANGTRVECENGYRRRTDETP